MNDYRNNNNGGYNNNNNNRRSFQRRPRPDYDGRELYFVAILPPDTIADELYSIKKEFADNFESSYALKIPEHITLIPPFRRSPDMEADYAQALESFAPRYEPFVVSVNGFGAFEPRVIYAAPEDSAPLNNLQAELVKHFVALELIKEEEIKLAFHPHLTVAYRDLTPENFDKAWPEYKDRPYQASFVADAISIMKLINGRWKLVKKFDLIGG